MDVFHNSHDLNYRSPFGAVPPLAEVLLCLDAAPPPASCRLLLWRDGEPPARYDMVPDGAGTRFSVTITAPPTGSLLWYTFELTEPGGRILTYGNNEKRLGGPGLLTDGGGVPYQITVSPPERIPAWYADGVVYQIFPDRFRRGNDWAVRRENAHRPENRRGPRRVFQEDWTDVPFYTTNKKGDVTRWPFFGGTLEGIREKLLYLKSLGVGAIYLNPIFLAASNHRYDTADYTAIDPGLGDGEGFRLLAGEARALGIRLILDGVFAHTGADSVYFDKFGNYGPAGHAGPAGAAGVAGVPGACAGPESPYYGWYSFTSFPDRYDCWWGVDDLPKTDKNNASYREFIYGGPDSVVRRWLRLGARGWRLDVADELPDDFIRGIRQAMTETEPDSVLLGEVWEDASSKISYGDRRTYLLGGALQSVTNYPFRALALDFMLGKADAFDFAASLRSLCENYPAEAFRAALTVIGSHDRPRALTLLGDPPADLTRQEKEEFSLTLDKAGLARERLKLLALLQYTVPGVPCVYYGDEAGLQGFEDPFNRAPYPWGREETDLREHFRLLGLLRSQHRPLREGDFTPGALTGHVLSVSRRTAEEELLLVVNRGIFEHETAAVRTDAGYILELTGSEELSPAEGKLELALPPLSAKLLLLRRSPPPEPALGRSAGILCALSSVPAREDSGHPQTTGKPSMADIFRFVDFLADSGQRLWQLLPLNPAGKGASPFYSPSLFALGDIVPGDAPTGGERDVADAYRAFCAENVSWLNDGALYAALLAKNGGKPWQEWPENEKRRFSPVDMARTHRGAIEVFKLAQFHRHRAWTAVREYAADRGVTVIGDLPIYAAPESADVWAHQKLFRLSGDGHPAFRAGVPPDYFSPEGQNWGNPLYDWDNAREELFLFWERRLRRALALYDVVRLDHFRSFSAAFAIPSGARAADGHWLAGPGIDFFREMRARLGRLPVIAEDLGVQDAPVRNLLKLSGLPGMLVWQFCADELPAIEEAELEKRVMYSGTHDNQTLTGWCSLRFRGEDPRQQAVEIIEKLYALPAPWVITPLQDVLGLDDDARMNVPGTATGNWSWRADAGALTGGLAEKLRALSERYGRVQSEQRRTE